MLVSGAQHSDPWHPTPVFLPEKSHGQRSLAGYSPWGHKESDMAEWLSTHTEIKLYVCVCVCVCVCVYGFPGGSAGKEVACNEGNMGDPGSIPGLGRSPGEGHGNPLQYCCLENLQEQRSLVGYSPWVHRVGHDWACIYIYFPVLYSRSLLFICFICSVYLLIPYS